MWQKIRCDGEYWKFFGFRGELNKTQDLDNKYTNHTLWEFSFVHAFVTMYGSWDMSSRQNKIKKVSNSIAIAIHKTYFVEPGSETLSLSCKLKPCMFNLCMEYVLVLTYMKTYNVTVI